MKQPFSVETIFPSAEYVVENAYIYMWESDVFIQMKSGYHYELEHKISRSDFKADFKKSAKHYQLSNSKKDILTIPGREQYVYTTQEFLDGFGFNINEFVSDNLRVGIKFNNLCSVQFRKNRIPNRFYYITPKGLLSKSEIPDYAGLLEYSEQIVVQKKVAPWLHKRKDNYDKILLDKYKIRYNNVMDELKSIKYNLEKIDKIYQNPYLEINQGIIDFD